MRSEATHFTVAATNQTTPIGRIYGESGRFTAHTITQFR